MAAEVKPWQLVVNIITTVVFIIVFVLFEDSSIITAYRRGFYCDDDSITKPYIKTQVISTKVLILISILLIVVAVLVCELFKKLTSSSGDKENVFIGNFKMRGYVYRLISRLGLILVGAMMTVVVVGIGKKMLGRLRPHFIQLCKPNYNQFNCTDGYITNYVCTSTDLKAIEEARLAFPSGHSAISGFVAVIIALYIHYTIKLKTFCLLKSFIQYVVVCIGIACAFTRISDYYHHWSDVLAGLLIGVIHAIYTIYGLIRLHIEERDYGPLIAVPGVKQVHAATSPLNDVHVTEYNGNGKQSVKPEYPNN